MSSPLSPVWSNDEDDSKFPREKDAFVTKSRKRTKRGEGSGRTPKRLGDFAVSRRRAFSAFLAIVSDYGMKRFCISHFLMSNLVLVAGPHQGRRRRQLREEEVCPPSRLERGGRYTPEEDDVDAENGSVSDRLSMQDIRPLPQMDSYGTAANLRMGRRPARADHGTVEEEDEGSAASDLRLSFGDEEVLPEDGDGVDCGRSSLESMNDDEHDNGTGVRMFHTLSHYLRESRGGVAASGSPRETVGIPTRTAPRPGHPPLDTVPQQVFGSPAESDRFSSCPREVDSPSGPFPRAHLAAHQRRHANSVVPRYFNSLRVQAPKSPPKPLPEEDEPVEGPAGALRASTRRQREGANGQPPPPRRSSLLPSVTIREDDSEVTSDDHGAQRGVLTRRDEARETRR